MTTPLKEKQAPGNELTSRPVRQSAPAVLHDQPVDTSIIQIVPQTDSLSDAFRLIDQARVGLANSELREVSKLLELRVRELAQLLATTERTLARRLEDESGDMNKAESERLLLLLRLNDHGVAVFEDQGKFNRWLRRPLPILCDQSPLELLDTASGFQVVDELLGRIEYGVYS